MPITTERGMEYDFKTLTTRVKRDLRFINMPLNRRFVELVSALEQMEQAQEAGKDVRVPKRLGAGMAAILKQSCYVYFLFCPSNNLVKIGKSATPKKRIKALQTQSPVKLDLLCFARAHDTTEEALHKALADYREHGEWFRMEGDVLDAAAACKVGADAILLYAHPWLANRESI